MIHPLTDVHETAKVGEGTTVWPGAWIGARVCIGCNCLVARNVCIDPDVTIGDNCVTHDVPAHTLVVGVPAREVRRI